MLIACVAAVAGAGTERDGDMANDERGEGGREETDRAVHPAKCRDKSRGDSKRTSANREQASDEARGKR